MAGMKQGSLFGMTYITWMERQTNGSLFEKTELGSKKTLSIKIFKNSSSDIKSEFISALELSNLKIQTFISP